MGETRSVAEVRQKYMATMPAPLGEAYTLLFNHTARLYAKRDDFNFLFGSAANIDLLNATAPQFFHDVQQWLHESILLHLRRFADPADSGGKSKNKSKDKRNLSLKGFQEILPSSTDQNFRNSFATAIDDVDYKTNFAKDWRDKKLGHTPLPDFAGGATVVLPPADISDMDRAVASIGEAMNCVHRHYVNHDIYWDKSIGQSVGTGSLMHYLRKGLDSQRLEDASRRP